MSHGQRGYSLVELLVVVGIVGLISLVGVPAFITYFNSARVTSALREFTTELRGARQRAVTRNRPVKFSFETGAGERSYWIYDGDAGGTSWTLLGAERQLPEYIFLHDSTFEDEDDPVDGQLDIVFQPNGTITQMDGSPMVTETEGGKQVTKLLLRSESDIPYNEYTIYFSASGQLSTTRSKY